MISFGQIIGPQTDPSPVWEAARAFIYGSVITNLTATMLALLAILFCSELESNALRKVLDEEDSLPHRVARHKELIPAKTQRDKHGLIRAFGISPYYKWVELGQLIWVILGMCSTFLALASWVWLSQSHTVFVLLMMPLGFGFVGLAVCLIGPIITNK